MLMANASVKEKNVVFPPRCWSCDQQQKHSRPTKN